MVGGEMTFKNQAEIFQSLLNGAKVLHDSWPASDFVHLVNGFIVDEAGEIYTLAFNQPELWEIFIPPKPKKTFELHEAVMEYMDGYYLSWVSKPDPVEGATVYYTGKSKTVEVECE